MSVLLLTEIFPPVQGGSGRWFWELYRRLPRNEVVIAAGQDSRQAAFDATHDLRLERLRLTWSKHWGLSSMAGVRLYWKALRAVRRLVKRNAVTELHCARLMPEGWIAWMYYATSRMPYICYVHGEELSIGRQSREIGMMMRPVLRNCRLLIANSRNTARLLTDEWGAAPEKVHVLHPGVDIEAFVPADRSAEIRRELGWDDRMVLLTASRLQPRKGHGTLIRALPQIRRDYPDLLYAIVGDGGYRGVLETLVEDMGLGHCVLFHGEVDDESLVRCYQQCDLFVLPNREVAGDFEGFGMVLVEAQACGKPVVAGTSGGTAETMRVPETGRIVPCDTPEPLAELVIELLARQDLRNTMGLAAREWVTDRFSWETLVRQAAEMFGMNLNES